MITSLPLPLRLYFIRHGETEWSLSGQHGGRADIPLTARGEDEARAVGQRLCDIPFAQGLTSPLRRAQQTCALAALGPTPRTETDLAEWDNGDDEGRTSTEILKSRPDWNRFFRDGSPNGETRAQISDRADRFLAQVRALAGNVALFSHSHSGCVLAARWIGLPVAQAHRLMLNTASISVLYHTDQPAIALWNFTASESFDPASEPNRKFYESDSDWQSDRIDVYYGMADSRIGVARLDVSEQLPPGAPADGDGPKAGGQE